MQKWEYCYLTGMGINDISNFTRASGIAFPDFNKIDFEDIIYFLHQKNRILLSEFNLLSEKISILLSDFNKWQPDHVFITNKIIKALGESGWELVGCGNISEWRHCIYFKRPIAN